MNSAQDIDSELNSFREQWRAEVRARNPALGRRGPGQSEAGPSGLGPSTAVSRADPAGHRFGSFRKPLYHDHDEDYVAAPSFDDDGGKDAVTSSARQAPENPVEPVSALDYYEKAVEQEAVGQLGESVRLYRKAYRMDHSVDQKYKNKHFPAASFPKSTHPNPASASSSTVPGSQKKALDSQPPSLRELIESFAGISLEPAPPRIEGTPAPPCPIAGLPEEILVHIMRDVAIRDVADFVRLSQVCKRFAYLVATEDRIWRRVCEGDEVGFGSMHYRWQKDLEWDNLEEEHTLEDVTQRLGTVEERQREEKMAITTALAQTIYSSSWQKMFRTRPRIRFNGCYISTVNYIRAGQASTHQITWNSPVHIVTYYRYLRFFRDGTVISLLTTAEPADVVHHLSKDTLAQHKNGVMAHLPSAVMQFGLKGRWRLSSAVDNPEAALGDAEGDLSVETEGVGKYVYRMELSMKSAGKGSKNNKLSWRGFYSYNKLTDDWAEFGLKNDKPFFFSRVKSYGMGG